MEKDVDGLFVAEEVEDVVEDMKRKQEGRMSVMALIPWKLRKLNEIEWISPY